MAINPFISLATGALTRREEIRDERAESAGELIDVVSDYFFSQTFPAEELAIKNDAKLYDSIAQEYTPQVAEGLSKMGYISAADGDLGSLKSLINDLEKNKPGFIEQLKNADPKDVMYGQLFADRNKEKTANLKDNKDLIASVLQDRPELAKLNFGNELKTGKLTNAQNFLFGGPKLDKSMAPQIVTALDDKLKTADTTEEEPTLAERVDYKPPLPGSRVETKYAQINKSIMDKNPAYGTAVSTGVQGEFNFNLAKDYQDQYLIHTVIAENVEQSPEGSGQTQGSIATISNNQLQNEIIKPAIILNLGDDNYKEDFVFQSGLNIYLNLNKAIKANNKNPLDGQLLNDFKLSDTTKGFIANTIKSLSDSELSLYDVSENERSIFSGNLTNVSSDQFADAYAQALIITGYKIHQKHGEQASSFFFKSLPEIEYAQQDGDIAKVKSFAMLEFNKLKNKSLNNR